MKEQDKIVGILGPEIIEFLDSMAQRENVYISIETHMNEHPHFDIKIVGIDSKIGNIVMSKDVLMGCNADMTMYKTEEDEERLEITLHLF